MMNKTHETIFTKKYLYDGIQNIQFSDKARIVYLQKILFLELKNLKNKGWRKIKSHPFFREFNCEA